jgi:hypothetical protein
MLACASALKSRAPAIETLFPAAAFVVARSAHRGGIIATDAPQQNTSMGASGKKHFG